MKQSPYCERGIVSWAAHSVAGVSPYLLAAFVEEAGRVHAIGDGAADNREPVEDDRGLVGVLEEDLLQDIERNGEDQHGGD